MNRRSFCRVLGVGAGGSLAGCLSSGLRDDDYDIGMSANAFLPERYTISVGETVVWGNNGSRGHTVTAYDELPEGATYFASGGYDSNDEARHAWFEAGGQGGIEPGETFSHTFEVPGTFGYYCIPHEAAGMVGAIIVE